MSLFDDLKAAIGDDWRAYTEHAFVRQLGEGALPLAAFQDYLVQDYLFLVQFARANALAAYKSRTLADIADATAALTAVLRETELHRSLTRRWGIAPAQLDAAPEKQVTVAYTRYVLDTGMSGDLLDLHVALAPCTVGYAEIGLALAPRLGSADAAGAPRAGAAAAGKAVAGVGEAAGAADAADLPGNGGAGADAVSVAAGLAAPDAHPYREWIAEYAGAEFQQAADRARARLDALAGGPVSADRFRQLTAVFATATRLEAAFWQQALDASA